MPNERVLLVDDEEEFTEILSERMETRGLRVDIATSGEQALERVTKRSYDAIILDLSMPGMDGMETLQRIRAASPELQIILLTGHATLEKAVAAVKMGALDFLEKPADIQKLIAKIEEAGAKKMGLVEKQNEEKIRKIMESKGW